MNFRGILFDKDGTLIEADAIWVPFYRRLLMRMKSVDEAAAETMMADAGYDISTGRMRAGSIMAGGTTAQLVDIWWQDHTAADRKEIMFEIDRSAKQDVQMDPTPVTDLVRLINLFKAKDWQVGVATNDSLISTKRQINALGIDSILDAVITSDTVAVPKPSGHMIRRFSDLTGLKSEEIVMVGDNYHDIAEARRGGAGLAVGVLSGNGAHEDLHHIADVTFDSVEDLIAHFELV
jgi:phosphoglycolate phosphatase